MKPVQMEEEGAAPADETLSNRRFEGPFQNGTIGVNVPIVIRHKLGHPGELNWRRNTTFNLRATLLYLGPD